MFARIWSRVASRVADDDRRAELVRGLSGRVLEVGCGDGRGLRHYPAAVGDVVAVEPEPYLRRLAESAASAARVRVTVVDAGADRLPADAGSCDAVVVSLVLCSVDDQPGALAEILRVLRPGGELRFLEHVVADDRRVAGVQRGLDRSGVWPRLAGGCHLSRDTVAAIETGGLEIEGLSRFSLGPGRAAVPFVLGRARRPGPTAAA